MVQWDGQKPCFLILHLFSGRRRQGDVHWHLHRLAARHNLELKILSLDTAVAPSLGNLQDDSPTWQHVRRIYHEGLCAASIAGTPCETFSEARFNPPEDPDLAARWPRPVRSAQMLFGLNHLSAREYRQLQAGSSFFLQGLLGVASHAIYGGCMFSEHPAPPFDEARPSIWSSSAMTILRQHPDINLHILPQYKWGAQAIKPTGILAVNAPAFNRWMWMHSDPHAKVPETVVIGKGDDGRFRTAAFKEYSDAFCAGLAEATIQTLRYQSRNGCRCVDLDAASDLVQWIIDCADASAAIRTEATWLPDWQG
eukprot:Skav211131  [mRNA]  locus=scaffold1786:128836:129765:- [translate_table: standard]